MSRETYSIFFYWKKLEPLASVCFTSCRRYWIDAIYWSTWAIFVPRRSELFMYQLIWSSKFIFFKFCLRNLLLCLTCLVLGPGNFCLVHVSLVPVLNVVGEQVSMHMCLLLSFVPTVLFVKEKREWGTRLCILLNYFLMITDFPDYLFLLNYRKLSLLNTVFEG